MAAKNKTIEYRHAGVPGPAQPTWWRQRGPILATGAALLVILILLHAGPSARIVFASLIVDGSLLTLWLLAAAGYGHLLPLPGTPGRGQGRGASGADQTVDKIRAHLAPLPRPLPEYGEREVALFPVTRIALGLGILSTLQLLLGLAGVLQRPVAFAVLAIGIALLLLHHRKLTRDDVVAWLKTPADYEWLWLLAVPILAMTIVAAYAPPGMLWGDEPHGYDVLSYHLQLPREWYELGRIAPLKHNVFSYFPLAVEMHYLLAMQLAGGPWAGMYLAQLMHVSMIVLTVVAVYATARQFAPKLPSILAALAAASVPWLMLLGSVAYNEGGLLLFGTLAIGWASYSLSLRERVGVRGREESDSSRTTTPPHPNPSTSHEYMGTPEGEGTRQSPALRPCIIAGLFAGLACGCKLTAVPLVLLTVPIVMTVFTRNLRGCAIYILTGLLVFSPWLIRNSVWTGNPVFPEAQSIFGRGHFSETQQERWRRAHSPTPSQQSLTGRLKAAKDQLATDWRYGYFLWLPAIVAIVLAIRRPQARVFAALLVLWLSFWLTFTHLQGRFFVLAIPIAALTLALLPHRAAIAAIVAIQLVIGTYLTHAKFRYNITQLAIFGLLHHDDLSDMTSGLELAEPGKPIALVGDGKAFLYAMPMSNLFYRTVFDVDVKPGQSVIDAWAEGAPPLAYRLIDSNELDRFARTYFGIPKADSPAPPTPASAPSP